MQHAVPSRFARTRVLHVTLFLCLLLAAPLAAAHGFQTGAEPAPHSAIADAPTRIIIRMSEPVEASFSHVRVLDEDATDHAQGTPSWPSGDESALAIDVSLPGNGTYTVAWETLWRSDGHVTKGSYGFAVGDAEQLGNISSDIVQTFEEATSSEIAMRALLFTGVMISVGSLAFLLIVDRRTFAQGRRRAVTFAAIGASLLTFATLLLLLHQTAAGRRTDLVGAVPFAWDTLRTTYVGKVLAVRLLLGASLMGVLAWSLRTAERSPLMLATLLAGAIVPTLSLVSHAASGDAWLVPVALDAAHVLAAGVWIGALPMLVASLYGTRGDNADVTAAVVRFSRLAIASVALVLLTGAVTSFSRLGGDTSLLVATAYGRYLLVKLALFGVLMLYGAYNQFILIPRVASHGGVLRLRRSAAFEVVLAAVVLIAAGGLTASSPVAASSTDVGGPVHLEADGEDLHVVLDIQPGRVGVNDLRANITILSNGTPLTYGSVNVTIEHAERDLGAAPVMMTHEGEGHYEGRASFGLSGDWVITIFVRRPDAYDDGTQFRITV